MTYGDFCVVYTGKYQQLIAFLQNHGVILNQRQCPHCENECRIDWNRKLFRCDKSVVTSGRRRKRCNYKVSLFKGTWFERSHIDIETNVKFLVLFVHDAFSFKLVRSELRLSDPTITDWCSFSREVIVSWVSEHSTKIGGEGKTVEIDESKFGRRKYNVGRLIEGQWVFGGICRETRDFFFLPVQQRNSETLLRCISENIEPGTTIISDCWRAYDCLSKEGFTHLTVNHSVNFKDPDTGAHTNTIERRWRDVKNLIPKYGRRKTHFVGYLATAYFKICIPDGTRRLHVFLKAASKLYPLAI